MYKKRIYTSINKLGPGAQGSTPPPAFILAETNAECKKSNYNLQNLKLNLIKQE